MSSASAIQRVARKSPLRVLVRGEVRSGGLVLGSGLARAKDAWAEGARRVFARLYSSI